jgi:hypothetical protein
MRCYLMKSGEIQGIEYLADGPDEDLVEQAIAILKARARQGIEGVEVWSGRRFVYRAKVDQILPIGQSSIGNSRRARAREE